MIHESQIDYLLNGELVEADTLNRPLRQLVSATNASTNNTTRLMEERYDDAFEVLKDGSGFTRERDAQLIFDAENATVSIAPGLGKSTWFYYHRGRKIESSETLTHTLSEDEKTNGGFYLSFNDKGDLVNTGPYPDFYNTTLCFYVHYSNGEFIIEGDERHGADRDTAWHLSHHREDGMVVYTLGSIDWTPDDADNVGIQLTSTLVADEDLQHLIKHSPTGKAPFSQILEGYQDAVRIPTLYYDGSIRYLDNKRLPWVADALKYNDDTTLKDVPDGKFVNYFLVATHCQKYPIKLIMGRKIFDSDHETVDETLESLGLNFPEIAMLYRISLERDNSLSTMGKCKLKSVQEAASKITFESASSSAGSGLSNHAQLLGRTEDNSHPMSSITGLQTVLSEVQNTITYQGQPTMTSNAVLNHVDNSIIATGIVTNLGLEIGDVIEVDNDNLQSGILKPLGQTVGKYYQFATKGNDVYVANGTGFIMKQTNGEGLFEKIEGVPAALWVGICFIGNQMYAAIHQGLIYSVNEATGAITAASPTNQTWVDITTDGTHIYGCLSNSGIIYKVDPISKTQVAVVPTTPSSNVYALVYSPIDNSLYIGANSGAQPIRKLVNMTGTWIDVSTEKRPWTNASYYNGKVYFSDFVGQVWKENDAGDDFELFSKKPLGSPDGEGCNIIVNDMLYKAQHNGDIYTTPIIKKDLFTVESIVSADKIIVNYAHAFGAGSKSLWYQTLSAAKFKRIAKWYNAPIGLGQAWINMSGSRVAAVDYTNNTGRSIQIGISASRITVAAGAASFNAFVDGVNIATDSSSSHTWTTNVFAEISNESTYRAEWPNTVTLRRWAELR